MGAVVRPPIPAVQRMSAASTVHMLRQQAAVCAIHFLAKSDGDIFEIVESQWRYPVNRWRARYWRLLIKTLFLSDQAATE